LHAFVVIIITMLSVCERFPHTFIIHHVQDKLTDPGTVINKFIYSMHLSVTD